MSERLFILGSALLWLGFASPDGGVNTHGPAWVYAAITACRVGGAGILCLVAVVEIWRTIR